MKKLEAGEKYITIDIGGLKIGLFKNKEKTKRTEPDFKGSVRVSAWVNTKKEDVKVEDLEVVGI